MTPSEAIFVAHRGDAARQPENTLAAFASAAKLGVSHLELDVQLTRDGVPIVLHDASLKRTHGLDVIVPATGLQTLDTLGVLTGGNRPPHIPRLAEFTTWMKRQPGLHVFIEIKKESLRAQGRERTLSAVLDDIEPLRGRATVISYDARILSMARHAGWPIGYALETLGGHWRGIAERLAPEYLFAEVEHLLRLDALWPGAWQWVAFEVEDVTTAERLSRLGIDYLETMNPALLARHP
jgi:glycerophosphoryl diester phosphodiesterase